MKSSSSRIGSHTANLITLIASPLRLQASPMSSFPYGILNDGWCHFFVCIWPDVAAAVIESLVSAPSPMNCRTFPWASLKRIALIFVVPWVKAMSIVTILSCISISACFHLAYLGIYAVSKILLFTPLWKLSIRPHISPLSFNLYHIPQSFISCLNSSVFSSVGLGHISVNLAFLSPTTSKSVVFAWALLPPISDSAAFL